MTGLMYSAATDHGDIEIARLLMARGADLNARATPAKQLSIGRTRWDRRRWRRC